MNRDIIFKIGYGLYLMSAKIGDKDNGCIINTVMQVTDTPLRIAVTVNKSSYTGEIVIENREFNISILSTSAPFSLFKTFGFQSGRKINKFQNIPFKRSKNGIAYLQNDTVGYMSCKVVEAIDLGTHYMFICNLIDSEIISDDEPVTYAYYHKNIKQVETKTNTKGWRCVVCGYVYEGENLPPDFICPWCKHGVVDFERIES